MQASIQNGAYAYVIYLLQGFSLPARGVGRREPCSQTTVGCFTAVRQATPTEPARPAVLGLAFTGLERLAVLSGHCQTRNGDPVAPAGLQAVLAMEVQKQESRASKNQTGNTPPASDTERLLRLLSSFADSLVTRQECTHRTGGRAAVEGQGNFDSAAQRFAPPIYTGCVNFPKGFAFHMRSRQKSALTPTRQPFCPSTSHSFHSETHQELPIYSE